MAVVAEGLEEGAVAAGLTRDQAREMVQAVLGGTAALLADGTDPAALRQRVSSPGGHHDRGRRRCWSAAACAPTSPTPSGPRPAGAAELVAARWTPLQTYVLGALHRLHHLIFVRILLSFVPIAPVSRWARAFFDFFHQSTDWFLGFFRRLIPPLGMFDLSPIVALIVLYILRDLVLTLLGQLLSDLPAWLTPGAGRRDRRGQGRAAVAAHPGRGRAGRGAAGADRGRRRTTGSPTRRCAPTWPTPPACGPRRSACGAAPAARAS